MLRNQITWLVSHHEKFRVLFSQLSTVLHTASEIKCHPLCHWWSQNRNSIGWFLLCFRDQFTYSCGRTSPIWPVNEQAKTTPERPHTTNLAQPKKYHRQFNHDRSLPTQVSEPATRAVCSGTIEALARPKSRKETQFREPMWEVR